MALIDCGECGRMASDQAAACPHCGVPIVQIFASPLPASRAPAVAQRSVGFWLGLGIFLVPMIFAWFLLRLGHSATSRIIGFGWLVFALFAALGHEGEDAVSGGSTSSTSARSQSAKVAQQVEPLHEYTAQQMAAEYERNTVAADQHFKGRRFKVTGVVDSINTDLFGKPYVTLRGGVNQFMEPQFKLSDAHANYAAGLQQGMRITLICKGRGDVAKTPMSDECIPDN
ncbi:hypothetical protein [Pseudomonas sp. 2FG]|uniref:OB-fold protein n=1 Tax=Pseudomonas sp. 2FG TaxID=2502191 RepID=UPI0010F7995D|nr:hypothetical protein [Pseudomonas sp. 2FG]